MATNWKEYKISELGTILNNRRIPLNSREREIRKGKYPYYGASGIVDYIDNFIFEGEHVLISEDGENLRTRQTPIAFKADGKFWVNNHAHIFKGSNKFINDYIVYFFQNLDINPYITGAVQPKLNKENLLSIPISVPEENTLIKIVETLRAYDNKLELDQQMYLTLEAIAQTLFTEWFVRFNFPGFDNELVDGLPRNWRMGTLGEVIRLNYGKALKADTRGDGIFPVIGSSGIVGFHDNFLVQGPGIVIGRKGTIGEVIWLDESFFPIDTTFYVENLIDTNGLCFTYYLLKQQNFKHIASDSAVPGLNRNEALRNEVIIPTSWLIESFNQLVEPIFEKKRRLKIEIQTLTQLRDSLLPKLMSGQISVGADV